MAATIGWIWSSTTEYLADIWKSKLSYTTELFWDKQFLKFLKDPWKSLGKCYSANYYGVNYYEINWSEYVREKFPPWRGRSRGEKKLFIFAYLYLDPL